MKNQKLHYHLVAGDVLFQDPANGDQTHRISLNTTIATNDRNIPARLIGKAQQAMQMRMFEILKDEKLRVIDVFVMAVSYLGLMTEKEFTAPPAGTKLEEIPTSQALNS